MLSCTCQLRRNERSRSASVAISSHCLSSLCLPLSLSRCSGKTVMDHKIRTASVTHCKWVDETLSDAPWVIDDAYLTKHNIDFVAHDAIPYQV